MNLLGLIGLIFLLYTFYIIGRVLYTGYSFMRAMGIKPKFTRKGPKFETDFGGSQRTTQQQSHNTGSSGNAHHEGALRATQNLATAKYLVKTKENISTLKK